LQNWHLQKAKIPFGGASDSVISSSPYYQNKTTKNKGVCQIDLLIETNLNVLYACEFKCQSIINKSVIKEMKVKLSKLKVPKGFVIKPVLVFEGEIYPPDGEEIQNYFFKTNCFIE